MARFTTDLKYIFEDLISYTEYTFKVCSNNDVSLSNAGETEGSCVDANVKTQNGGELHSLLLFISIFEFPSQCLNYLW